MSPARSHGSTLIELLFVIGVIVAASAATFGFASYVDRNRSTQREAQELSSLIESIDRAYAVPFGHYSGVTAQRVFAEGLAPSSFVSDGRLQGRWGNVVLEPITIGNRIDAGLRVVYPAVPQAQCFAFARLVAKGQQAIHVNGIAVYGQGTQNASNLAQACQAPKSEVTIDHDIGSPGTLIRP